MKLTLTVLDPPAILGPRAYQVWHEEGGVIGRDASCDWVLPDPGCEVSRRHARVTFRDSAYWIEDLNSVNGVLIAATLVRIGVERPYRLKDDEGLVIGDYRIRVAIESDVAVGAGRRADPGVAHASEIDEPGARFSPGERPAVPLRQPESLEPMRVPDQHFVAPAIQRTEPAEGTDAEGLIPADWLRSRSLIQTPKSVLPVDTPQPRLLDTEPPAQTPAVAAGASSDDAGRRLLAAAGIELGSLDAELAEDFGRTFRVAMHGLMELLRARAEVKTQFRMEVSRFQARGNNPLKFAVTADEALDEFFVHKNHRDLPAVEAVAAGIDDLKWHQLALMAGMRHAFFEILRSFDPAVLKQRFEEESAGRAGFTWAGGQKPWDQYVAMYEGIRRDTETYFKRVFGEAFVEEYERQVRELEKKFGSSSTEGRRRMSSKPRRNGDAG